MQPILRPLIVLHGDAALREHLRQTSASRYRHREVSDWEELREALREEMPVAIAVVDPYRPDGRSLATELRSLIWDFPTVTVVAALEVRRDRIRDLRTLGEWGVKEVVSIGEDDTPEALVRRIRTAQGRPLQSLLERSLPANLSGRGRALLMAAAEVVAEGGHGRDLAARLRLSERTLLRWAEQADLPPPRRVLAWMRVLLACELLDDPSQTVLSIAYTCGYASDSSLRRAVQEFTGMQLADLRRRGAFGTASGLFARELEQTREGALARRKAERAAARATRAPGATAPAGATPKRRGRPRKTPQA
jgi:AraC-like DNA-binding protein